MTMQAGIALIGVSIAIPSGLAAAIHLYVLRELRDIHKRLLFLENK